MEMSNSQKRALALKRRIEQACIEYGLNLTIYNDGIGFVDQDARKIVMVWSPWSEAEKGEAE